MLTLLCIIFYFIIGALLAVLGNAFSGYGSSSSPNWYENIFTIFCWPLYFTVLPVIVFVCWAYEFIREIVRGK